MPLPAGYTIDQAAGGPPPGYTIDKAPEAQPSLAHDALKYSPVGMVQGLADAIRDPKHALAGILSAPQENAKLLDKAKESYQKGDYTGAAAHFLNYLVPGGSAFEDAGSDFQKGDISHGLAKTAGMATSLVAGAKAPEILQTAGKAADAVKSGISTASDAANALTSPEVARAAIKVAPKGSAALDAYDKGKARFEALRAARQPAPPPAEPQVIRVSPAYADFPQDMQAPPQSFSPTPATATPTGRVPGGISNQALAPVPVAVARPSPAYAQFPQNMQQAPPVFSPVPANSTLTGRIPGSAARAAERYAAPPANALPPSEAARVFNGIEFAPEAEGMEPPPAPAVISPAAPAQQEYQRVTDPSNVSGLAVRKKIPNLGSIESTLSDFEELPGIREIPLSDFPTVGKDAYKATDHFRAVDDINRVSKLADQIKASGEINPLIVVMDKDGPYILEGGHRLAALHKLGKQTLPAKVVIDRESLPEASMPAPQVPIAEQLRAEMLKNGYSDPAPAPAEAPVTAEGKVAIRDMMREVPGGAGKKVADANYAGNQDPAIAGAAYEAGNRADNAAKLANALHAGGISHESLSGLTAAEFRSHLKPLADSLGVKSLSKETIGETLFRLQRLAGTQ